MSSGGDWETLRDGLGITLRPIEQWPQPSTRDREASPFRVTLGQTLKLLERELRMLAAKSPVLQIAIREGGFRRDGLPRADARAEHPGVILSFESKFGPLLLPCDTFRSWQDNLRAIGMHLENLRHASLYGVGRRGEQYRGWKALGAGPGDPFAPAVDPDDWDANREITAEEGARIFGMIQGAPWGPILASPSAYAQARPVVLRLAHPDHGGTADRFLQAQSADRALKQHHRLKNQ